jgi:hypothetical protein
MLKAKREGNSSRTASNRPFFRAIFLLTDELASKLQINMQQLRNFDELHMMDQKMPRVLDEIDSVAP